LFYHSGQPWLSIIFFSKALEFGSINCIDLLLDSLKQEGYDVPFQIQDNAHPPQPNKIKDDSSIIVPTCCVILISLGIWMVVRKFFLK
jgi:hypothetical protein